MKKFLAILFCISAVHANASNYASCILNNLPDTSSSAVHIAVMESCLKDNPSGFKGVLQGSGIGVFSFKDGNACTAKKAKTTTFTYSANVIAMACKCLYNKKDFPGQLCPSIAEMNN